MSKQPINLEEQLMNLVEVNQFIKMAKSQHIDLGKNPKRTLATWQRYGLIPGPIKSAESALHEKKLYYPEITLGLIDLIQREQSQGKNIEDIRENIRQTIITSSLKMPNRERASIQSFFREYGEKYGFYKKPMQIINALYEVEAVSKELSQKLEELKTLVRKYKSKHNAQVVAWYRDTCILCNRPLIGRGTKDKYTMKEIRKVIPSLPTRYESEYPFSAYACRSLRKCGAPNLLYLLKVQTGKYLYGREE